MFSHLSPSAALRRIQRGAPAPGSKQYPAQKPPSHNLFFAQAVYTCGEKPTRTEPQKPVSVRPHVTFSPVRFLQLKSAQKSDMPFFPFRNFSAPLPTRQPLGETPMVLMTWAKLAQGSAAKNTDSKHPKSFPRQVDRRPQKFAVENDINRKAFLQHSEAAEAARAPPPAPCQIDPVLKKRQTDT